MNQALSALFEPEPIQWGLRGDPYLWREMSECLRDTSLPESLTELTALLEAEFQRLTGRPLSHPENFHLQRHAHGGMSSGAICPEFWREHGIPLLLSRFAAKHASLRL